MKHRILYIEDEENLGTIVKETMELKGFEVMYLKHGLQVLDNIRMFSPCICILDVMLPHVDGFNIGSTIRQEHPQLPIIFLSAKGQTKDVLQGFASGATDYLKKPFSMEELIARIEVQIALTRPAAGKIKEKTTQKTYRLGSFTYTPDKLSLSSDRQDIHLSNREAEILNMFCMHINESINRKEILLKVWGDDSFFNSRNLDVYIKKLRAYFAHGEGVSIITLKGKGYIFSVT